MDDTDSADGTTRGENEFHFKPYRPTRSDKPPPCGVGCPSGTPVRDWIAEIAQGPDDEAGRREAYLRAWQLLVASNPFPATMGRICPHPCETQCNRQDKDGAVAVNALERFLGDWAIEQGWPLPVDNAVGREESIAVIGAGPAGMSFAYQMRRRGYPVTVYERHELAGGMLRYGVPDYRLPPSVLEAELDRIFRLGVELVAPVQIGVDVSIAELQDKHRVLFLGFGAQRGRHLGLPGEVGENIWSGVEFLDRVNNGDAPSLGEMVVVVGGGNTAIDAARVARRAGASVKILYRRRREDMPAIDEEIDAALEEGVEINFLTMPVALIHGDTGALSAIRVQRLEVTGTDPQGRAEVQPVSGEPHTILASSVISAVSQEPDWAGLDALAADRDHLVHGEQMSMEGLVLCAGGDLTGLDLASHAIGQGRMTAEAVHHRLSGAATVTAAAGPSPHIQADHYRDVGRVSPPTTAVSDRLSNPLRESADTITEEDFLQEISRCFSCGLCNGCSLCWMYCGGNGFIRLESPRPGHYFAFSTDECSGCGKCIELCPTGYVSEAH